MIDYKDVFARVGGRVPLILLLELKWNIKVALIAGDKDFKIHTGVLDADFLFCAVCLLHIFSRG